MVKYTLDSTVKWQSLQLVEPSFAFLLHKQDISPLHNLPANAGDMSDLWVRKIPCSRKWQPTPAFLSGKLQGQGSLASYSPWVAKSGTRLSMHCLAHHHYTSRLHMHSYSAFLLHDFKLLQY